MSMLMSDHQKWNKMILSLHSPLFSIILAMLSQSKTKVVTLSMLSLTLPRLKSPKYLFLIPTAKMSQQ